MAIIDGKETFDKLSEQLGNRYAAVVSIAKEARRRAESNDNIISHSEALSWVLTGETPEALQDHQHRSRLHNSLSHLFDTLDEELKYVDDFDVAFCVRESIKHSFKQKDLVYYYSNKIDPSQQSRVRVLTNMIWYKFKDN